MINPKSPVCSLNYVISIFRMVLKPAWRNWCHYLPQIKCDMLCIKILSAFDIWIVQTLVIYSLIFMFLSVGMTTRLKSSKAWSNKTASAAKIPTFTLPDLMSPRSCCLANETKKQWKRVSPSSTYEAKTAPAAAWWAWSCPTGLWLKLSIDL